MRRLLAIIALFPAAACGREPLAPPAAAPIRGLIIVDGKERRGASRSDLDTLDIEMVEVIKGPASASLYGEPMRCGPIVVKTKR